jgi:hypothetical protein
MSGVSLRDSPKLESLCENDFDMRSNSPESLMSRAERHCPKDSFGGVSLYIILTQHPGKNTNAVRC